MAGPVHVKGLAGLQRGFRTLDKDLSKELRTTLRRAAEPVRVEAEALAESSISNIGSDWSRFRTGVTTNVVYVAPRMRVPKRRYRRPNFATLLMERAMAPALKAHVDQIEREIGKTLDHLFKAWERF
jgi:hypothetical protein